MRALRFYGCSDLPAAIRGRINAGLSLQTALAIASALSDTTQGLETLRADPFSALFLGAVGLAVIAGLLLKPKVPAANRDNRPPSTSQIGEQLDYVLGRRIVAPKVFHVWGREQRSESVGGKKGFGGGGKQTVYYENAFHGICLGPGNVLHRILKGTEEVIFQGPVSPEDTPSGSVLHDIEGNSFSLYWGELAQPANTALAEDEALGVLSRWPYHCYVVWHKRKLGTAAIWADLNYDIECSCVGFPLPDSECSIAESESGAGDGGVNGAHALYQLLTGSYPHGIGMEPSDIDFGSLRSLGVLLETEKLAQNIHITNGLLCADAVEEILADISTFIVQVGDRLVFIPIREGQTGIVLDERMIVAPYPSYEKGHGSYEDDRLVFLFHDIERFYRDSDVVTDDDATARAFRRKNSREIRMATITHKAVATPVAERRKLLYLADANEVTFTGTRTARRLVPGQRCTVPTVGNLRITSIEPSSINGSAEIRASVDSFLTSSTGWEPSLPQHPSGSTAVSADDVVIPFEIPHAYAGEFLAVGVVRVRLDGSGVGATIWTSTDGTSYQPTGTQGASAAGGTLLEDLPENTHTIVETGPLFEASTAAMSKVLDLSGSPDQWISGQQVLFARDEDGNVEIMYVQGVTAVVGGYRLSGIVRARLGTRALRLPAGTVFGIIAADNITDLSSTTWAPGATLHVKSQPGSYSLDLISAETLPLLGKAFSPLPVDNLEPLFRESGQGLSFTWTDRIRHGTGAGAGEGGFGVAIGPDPDSEVHQYKLEVLTPSLSLIRTQYVTTTSWNYTWATMVSDLVMNKTFLLRITPMRHSYGAYPTVFVVRGTDFF